jgi:inosine-uridine nucleoside N-ribohydrolase
MARMTVIAVAVLIALALGGCATAQRAPTGRTPVVVDTDFSSDDILALLYLLERRDVDVRAVAVSGTGLVHCPVGARHARALLALEHRARVPVGCGRADPLAGFNSFPVEWRDRADAFFGLRLPDAGAPRARAVDVLHRAIAGAPRPVTLLSLAPLTDTAELLRAHPGDRARIARVVAMGGALRVPGNIGPGHERAEYNLWIDPPADREVLASGVPVTLVPLDATNDVPATVFTANALRGGRTAAARLATRVMTATGMRTGGQYFWDPLAAIAIARPDVLRYARMRLATDGRGRVFAAPRGATVRVALSADRAAFERQFLTTLSGRPVGAPTRHAGAALTCDGRACRYVGPHRGRPGWAIFDTVNRGEETITFVLARLSEGKTFADLRRYARRSLKQPSWLAPEIWGQTPPHSRMTWMIRLAPGEKALIAVSERPPRAWIVAPFSVGSTRR